MITRQIWLRRSTWCVGKLDPGEHAAALRPLEDLVEIFEAMETGTLGAKPLVAPALPR